jgi:hypothetical protein
VGLGKLQGGGYILGPRCWYSSLAPMRAGACGGHLPWGPATCLRSNRNVEHLFVDFHARASPDRSHPLREGGNSNSALHVSQFVIYLLIVPTFFS